MLRALLSVSDKSLLIPFAKELHQLGFELLATGGTANALKAANIPTTEVSDYTGFPEILEGRVKTLHPKIHGGLLARGAKDADTLKQHAITPIQLLICNLYPFAKTIQDPNCTLENAIENIDVGGPTMIRAAAKNHAFVTTIVDPKDYAQVITQLKTHKEIALADRQQLAQKAFAHTALYDTQIATYLQTKKEDFPNHFQANFQKISSLRYGENPHQAAGFYSEIPAKKGSLANGILLQGKPLSYNNLIDADAALLGIRLLHQHQSACIIIKHATPCGAAIAIDVNTAYQKAYQTDPQSAFGGIIAFNQEVTEALLHTIFSQQFVELILAPSFSQEAIAFAAQKPNVRLLVCETTPNTENTEAKQTLRSISGGLLIQDIDTLNSDASQWQVVTGETLSESDWEDIQFAWQMVKLVKSNAIVYANHGQTLGIGAGQTSRVFSAEIAALKAKDAKLSLVNSILASDAFLPFEDTVLVAKQEKVRIIVQPGGSKNDESVIASAKKSGIIMVFTGMRHFRH